MITAPLAPHLRAFAPEFARRFAMITVSLIAVIARGFLRNPRLVVLTIPLHRRLTRAARRCATLMALLAAGKIPTRAAKRRGDKSNNGALEPQQRPRAPIIRVPATRGFLIETLRHEAAVYRSQLGHLLNEPGAAALLAAAPAAGRFLRPLCRLLGLPVPEPLRLPPKPRRRPPAASPTLTSPRPPPAEPAPPRPRQHLCPRSGLRWPFPLYPKAKPA